MPTKTKKPQPKKPTIEDLQKSPFISVWCMETRKEHIFRKTAIYRWTAHESRTPTPPGGTRIFFAPGMNMVISEDFEVFTKLMETLS